MSGWWPGGEKIGGWRTTQWVRNMRVAGGGRLVLGKRVEEFEATEVPEDQRPELNRCVS